VSLYWKSGLIGVIIGALMAAGVFLLFSSGSDSEPDLSEPEPRGTISIIIDDFGFSLNATVQGYLEMSPDITCAIIPGQLYTESVSRLADSLGFEVLVHMPLESYGESYGAHESYLLSSRLNQEAVSQRINRAFHEMPMAVGMNNHQGSKATEDLQLMKSIARTLQGSNRCFVDSYTSPASCAFMTMRQFGVPTEVRQVFLDHEPTEIYVRAQLDSLIVLSHRMPVAIGIGHATRDITLQVLQREIPRLKALGYRFLPISQVTR